MTVLPAAHADTPVQPLPKPSGGAPFLLIVWALLAVLLGAPLVWMAQSGSSVSVVPGAQPPTFGDVAGPAVADSDGEAPQGSGWGDPSGASSLPAPSTTTTTITTTVPAPVTTSSTRSSVTATVSRTCGADGSGDCFLTLRAGPHSSTASLMRYDEGDTVQVLCQVYGDRAHSSAMDASSSVWAKTTDGGYVAAIYLDGIDQFNVTTPC